MKEIIERLTIVKAQNGFQVYLNDYNNGSTARYIPYVFETMEHLLEFISRKIND